MRETVIDELTFRNGGLNDSQGESGMARHWSRRHRASFHRFRSTGRGPVFFKTRFENERGTNPEELIAAAHAGSFTMPLAFGLQASGYTPTELTTEAAVTLEPEGQGFRITRSALTLLRASTQPGWKRPLLEWRAMPRRTVRSRRCLTRRSRWMPS